MPEEPARAAGTAWNLMASVAALSLMLILIATPFFLSSKSMFSNELADSSLIRALKLKRTQIDGRIGDLTKDKTALEKTLPSKLDVCIKSTLNYGPAQVDITRQPDCSKRLTGESRNPNLNSTMLLTTNQAIEELKKLDAEIANREERIDKLRKKQIEVDSSHDEAIADGTQENNLQVELFVLLLRYASIGAIGAIGFNWILRLGVYERNSRVRGKPVSATDIIWYLIGTMFVGAILAVIFVPRLASLSEAARLGALTPMGISVALAAGLVGDVALRALRKLFEEPTTK